MTGRSGTRPATVDDIHEIARSLPGVTLGADSRPMVYQVSRRSFIFFRNPRPDAFDPGTGERYTDVIVFWVDSEFEKEAILSDTSLPFFTTPHFKGHPSVLLRGSRVGELTRDELAEFVERAWLARAGPRAIAQFEKKKKKKKESPTMADFSDFPNPPQGGFVVTHFLVVSDQDRSREFYRSIFDGKVVLERDPVIMRVANSWLILNEGGGPTDDKPTVTLETPPDPNRTSAFLNVRVADIATAYREWSAKGADFLTEPKDHGREIRAYIRDPDGHLIEVGESRR